MRKSGEMMTSASMELFDWLRGELMWRGLHEAGSIETKRTERRHEGWIWKARSLCSALHSRKSGVVAADGRKGPLSAAACASSAVQQAIEPP